MPGTNVQQSTVVPLLRAESAISAAVTLNVLESCGVPKPNVKWFTKTPSPDHIDYLDLCSPADANILPDGVAESRTRPLLYFIRNDRLSAEAQNQDLQLSHLRRTLASRGERAFLAIIDPGVVRVIPVNLEAKGGNWEQFAPRSEEARTLFARMALGEYTHENEPKDADYVYAEMFDLLTKVANNIVAASPTMDRGDVLSLVGRALFLRFLWDRKVIQSNHLRQIAPGAKTLDGCFANPTRAARTCKWLDDTFNGDFLPLSDQGSLAWFRHAGSAGTYVFDGLRGILLNEQPAGDGFQTRIQMGWSAFDFAHVPVGLLSQVYEGFVWKWEPEEADSTSVHYTPRKIAEYLVEDAFDGLPKPDRARVLDPACGAGVFLVLTFRRLYRERWKSLGHRPERTVIRDILNQQLRGFDISESALRLAALSLYLTAIELDPKPTPPDALRFSNLLGNVLFHCRTESDPKTGPVAGSLDKQMLKGHRARYQLVVCNPPWTNLKKSEKALASTFETIGREVLAERKLPGLAATYENPDSVPDLPFIWRAMQWCTPGGRMAFVLPARLLFKQGDIGQRAREAIFQAVAVTGMLNCSNLSDSGVWPNMQQPFLLFFARNRLPKPSHSVRWITVHPDKSLNDRGEIRVDSKSIEDVSVEQTFIEPWLWKALALGTALDIEVIRKIKQGGGVPLQKYWEEDLGLRFGNGYQIKPQQPQVPASHIRGLPDVNDTKQFRFTVRPEDLGTFERETACFPRERDLYRQPLVLVKESPGSARREGRAWLSLSDVVFNQSFHGFSGAGNEQGEDLVRYIQLLTHSDLWMHYALLTSPKLGAERRVIYKEDLEGFPIIPWAKLSTEQQASAQSLSSRLLAEDDSVFPDIDGFFATLYRLRARDVEVVQDTLKMELPFKSVRNRANLPPTLGQRREFCARLEGVLRPFFKQLGQNVAVRSATISGGDPVLPYSVVTITNEQLLAFEFDIRLTIESLKLASTTGASMVLITSRTPRTLVIGILNHARYWTASRGRLCALRVLRESMGSFEK